MLVVAHQEPNGGPRVLRGNIIPGPPATRPVQGLVTVGPANTALFLAAGLAVEVDVGLGAAFALREKSGRARRDASPTAAVGWGRLVLPGLGVHFDGHSSRRPASRPLRHRAPDDALQIFVRFEVLLLTYDSEEIYIAYALNGTDHSGGGHDCTDDGAMLAARGSIPASTTAVRSRVSPERMRLLIVPSGTPRINATCA